MLSRQSSGSDETRAEVSPTPPKNSTPDSVFPPLHPVRTKVDIDHFDKDGAAELSRRLSRTASRFSTATGATQDPTADDFDYKSLLQRVLRKRDQNGVLGRDLGVTFENMTVLGAGSGLAYGETVGSTFSGITRLPAAIKSMRHPVQKEILKDMVGCIKPKEMLLVLGRPGSGCTSLLKVLSNNTEGFKSVEGEVSFDGISPAEIKKHHQGDVAYLPEDDHHLPTLTVSQTLTFAASARQPAEKARVGTRQEEIAMKRDVLVTLFGLRHTMNTKVGNDIVRGVSGGERKRVSIAELMTTGAKIACHDNSTRGLDASTALSYAQSLRLSTDIAQLSTILSLYQCGENIYTLFDKVCVLYSGEQIYFGRMDKAVQYFFDMGYKPQERQTSADFLVAVTDPNGRFVREGYEGKVPKTASEFARYFRESEAGKRNLAEVQAQKKSYTSEHHKQFTASAHAEKAKHLSDNSSYVISYPMQLRLACKRRFQMQMGDLPTLIITTVAAMFQAIVIGSVYFQMPKNTSGFFSRGGVIFFAILYNSFTGMAEITNSYSSRPVVVRQRAYAMIRPSADILALNLIDVPAKFITIFFFDLILYFMSGLQVSASQFFIFVLFTFMVNVAMLALFRALASSNRIEARATMMAGLVVLVIATYAGYVISRPAMHPWFRWLSYAQPVSFGFESLIANEFRTLDVPCSSLVPSGNLYPGVAIANQVCTTVGARPGQALINGADYLQASFGYTYRHEWRNLGIIFGYAAFFLAVNAITSDRQQDESASGGVMIFKRGTAPPELRDAMEGGANGDAEKGADPTAISDLAAAGEKSKHDAAAQIKPTTDVFTFRHLNYDVPIKSEIRRLLNDVSGFVQPGKMTALMGESGAGKTTLLNVLAQRVSTGVVTGDMLVNGAALPISFQRQTGYVQQQDVHMATTTVREALVFSALLRQPASTPKAEKLAYVEEVIELLEMTLYADALVGEVGFGLSVEQRKRLTIGVELAARPALLIFLDEPSSGLDSQSSWSIVQLLRKLADHGMSVLATIHQPSSELFQVFDRLLLLKKGGQVVYQGELGNNSSTLIKYMQDRSDLKCGEKDNPAEYILQVIGAGAGAKVKEDWGKLWKESEESKQIDKTIEDFHQKYSHTTSQADQAEDSGRGYAAHLGVQLKTVTGRAFSDYYRDPTYLMAKLGLNTISGLFIGFTFYKSKIDPVGLQNKLFAVFMAVVIAAPLSQQLQPKFIGLRTLYTARESPSRMYSWPVMVFANSIVEIPWNVFCGTIFFLCWYWTVGFPSGTNRAGYAYLLYMLFELYFASFAQFVAAMSPNATAASILFSTFFSFVIIFNGVVQPYSQLPYFWRSWMYRLTPFTYLIEGLVVNAVGGSTVTCKASQFQFLTPPSGQDCLAFLEPYQTANAGYAQVVDGRCGYCSYATGEQFLNTVAMKFDHRWRDVGFMCAYILFNYAATFFFTYLFTVVDWSKVSLFKKSKKHD